VDLLLVLVELFSLGVTAEALRANIGSKSAIPLQRGPVDPKFQVEWSPPTNHSSSQKTRLNDLSYGINLWTDLSTVLSQCTRLTYRRTDRRTDGQNILIARPRLHSMQRKRYCHVKPNVMHTGNSGSCCLAACIVYCLRHDLLAPSMSNSVHRMHRVPDYRCSINNSDETNKRFNKSR